MDRRSLFKLAALALAVTTLPARADPTFVLNDWTKGKRIPQIVRRSEIRECAFINIGNEPGYDWVEIITHDGRRVTSELSRSQDVAGLLRQLADAGVPINNVRDAGKMVRFA